MVSGDSFEMQMYIQGQNNVKLNTVIIQLVRACTRFKNVERNLYFQLETSSMTSKVTGEGDDDDVDDVPKKALQFLAINSDF